MRYRRFRNSRHPDSPAFTLLDERMRSPEDERQHLAERREATDVETLAIPCHGIQIAASGSYGIIPVTLLEIPAETSPKAFHFMLPGTFSSHRVPTLSDCYRNHFAESHLHQCGSGARLFRHDADMLPTSIPG